VPGTIPGPVGFAAFAAVKFGGYVLAGVALKKLQPVITASAYKIAAVRTGLGIVIGPLFTVALLFSAEHLIRDPRSRLADHLFYPVLFLMRFLVWILVISIFAKAAKLSKGQLSLYALGGAAWSCLLDLPGIALAFVSPGKIPFC
jgi:hypothetical protein